MTREETIRAAAERLVNAMCRDDRDDQDKRRIRARYSELKSSHSFDESSFLSRVEFAVEVLGEVLALGAEQERAATVRWLRTGTLKVQQGQVSVLVPGFECRTLAGAIEIGSHVGAGEGPSDG